MRIFMVGDIVGRPGREALKKHLKEVREKWQIDAVIANAENASGGGGLIPKNAAEIMDAGVDVMTLGDHAWDKPEVNQLWETVPGLVRPLNFPPETPGRGYTIVEIKGIKVIVLSLMGRTFMKYHVDCPFRALDNVIKEWPENVKVRLIDFHAETTSEKRAFGFFADGRVTAVVGTHTHVMTADEVILEKGTAYITDLGMTGPYDSVIGQDKNKIIQRFWTGLPQKFEVAQNEARISGVLIEADVKTGKALSIKRLVIGGDNGLGRVE